MAFRNKAAGTKNAETKFDFRTNPEGDSAETGTLRELLDELDPKYAPTEGAATSLDSLETNLAFIQELTGRTYKSLTEAIPLRTLKTIKLLYIQNKNSRVHLFRHLRVPSVDTAPTLEFRITGDAPRNQSAFKAINEILANVATEISPDRRDYIDGWLLRQNALLECIAGEQARTLDPLHAAFDHAPPALLEAIKVLTQIIAAYEPPTGPHREQPLHEALYTRIRALPLLHFVGEYQNIIRMAQLATHVPPLLDQITQFCETLPRTFGIRIQPHNHITSIEAFGSFVEEHALAVGKLVKQATGISSNRRDLLGIRNHAAKVLHAYLHHQGNQANLSETNLSTVDCLAALCVIRQQQNGDQKIAYTPRWIGQASGEISKNVLNQLDKKKPIEALYKKDYIPHGTLQLLYNRFCAFQAAFVGQTDSHLAWVEFRLAHLKAYAACHAHTDISAITQSLQDLDDYCRWYAEQIVHQAMSYVPDHSSAG